MTGKTTISTRTKVMGGLWLGSMLILAGVAGCGDKMQEPFKDAPRSRINNMQPMDVINGADGFSNVGSKCDGYGGRVFMAYHGDEIYAAITVKAYSELAPDDPCRLYRNGK